MPYILEICRAGLTIEIRKYYTWRYKDDRIPRGERRKPTTEEQWAINYRNNLRKMTRKINHNFHPGDYHTVLNYDRDHRPETWEDMKADITEFLKRLRRECKKAGLVLKYIRVMEVGKKGARHHHLVMNEIPVKMIRKCWTKGRIHVNPLDDTGQYKDLAEYLLKFTDEAVKKGLLKKRWDSSKNLEEPPVEKKIIARHYFQDKPQEKKGYYLDKDSIRDYVDSNGNQTFSYTLIKIRGDTG